MIVWLALLPSFTAWLTLLVRTPTLNLTAKKPYFSKVLIKCLS
jgi:hypothetical protein